MTSKEERFQLLEEMKDVRPMRRPARADVQVPREMTPGILARQRAAVAEIAQDDNHLTADMVDWLGPHDELSFQRPGVQNSVFRKLKQGLYQSDARLDLHNMIVDDARKEVFTFIHDCQRYSLRNVLILHGKGERNVDGIAVLKSYLAKWLKELHPIMAFHTAQRHHGGTGAVYVMLRKTEQAKQDNRERHRPR